MLVCIRIFIQANIYPFRAGNRENWETFDWTWNWLCTRSNASFMIFDLLSAPFSRHRRFIWTLRFFPDNIGLRDGNCKLMVIFVYSPFMMTIIKGTGKNWGEITIHNNNKKLSTNRRSIESSIVGVQKSAHTHWQRYGKCVTNLSGKLNLINVH